MTPSQMHIEVIRYAAAVGKDLPPRWFRLAMKIADIFERFLGDRLTEHVEGSHTIDEPMADRIRDVALAVAVYRRELRVRARREERYAAN